MAERMLVVAAHAGDFVWRCGGAIAKYAAEGNPVHIVILSDGAVGEANSYWKKEGANLEECSALRVAEAKAAARALLGKEDIEEDFDFLGWEDHPMMVSGDRYRELAHIIRAFRPDFMLIHDANDAYNLDHNVAHECAKKAAMTARGAGWDDGLERIPRQIPMFGFEPQNADISRFHTDLFVDITDVIERKKAAMQAIGSQKQMYERYLRKAEARGEECVSRCGRKGCRYAEVFSVLFPIGAAGRFVY